MPFAMLPSVGPMEIIILLLMLVFYGAVIAFVVFVIRSLRRKTDQDRTIATLVEENRSLRDALAKQKGE